MASPVPAKSKPLQLNLIKKESKSPNRGDSVRISNSAFDSASNRSTKLVIKLPFKNNNNKLEEERENPNPQAKLVKIENKDDEGHKEVQSEENNNNNSKFDEDVRIWNLRPRGKKLKVDVKAEKIGDKEENQKNGGQKKEKIKLSINIAITKREIEEDIFAFTQAKPARRPKKRAKNVQKQLDAVFPGLGLVSITQDSYKVSENYMKD